MYAEGADLADTGAADAIISQNGGERNIGRKVFRILKTGSVIHGKMRNFGKAEGGRNCRERKFWKYLEYQTKYIK